MRLRVLASTVLLLPALVLSPVGNAASAGRTRATRSAGAEPLLTIVAAADTFNADIGDVSGLASWDGEHNSWNDAVAAAIDSTFGQMATHNPDVTLVAGDLVEGHWGIDLHDTGIFGPVGTFGQQKEAVRRAAKFYYTEWKRAWTSHGLPVPHIAVGDHEIGDNDWRVGGFKHRAFGTFKGALAGRLIATRYPRAHRARGTGFGQTSYWTELHPDVALVSVDVWKKTTKAGTHGGVAPTLTGGHLAWFRDTVAKLHDRYEWVIVEAHTPIATPVRSVGSSNIILSGGTSSGMWKAMHQAKVDLFLCGEVHAVTAIDRTRGPVQICHGGLFAFGGTKYLNLMVYADRIDIESWKFHRLVDRSSDLWQVGRDRVPRGVTYSDPYVAGTATLTTGRRLTDRTGDLAPATELRH